MSLYVQCHESWVTSGFHQLSCRWQNEYLKVFGASKAEGRENISWLKGRKLFFQKLLKFTFFFFLIWLDISCVRCIFISSLVFLLSFYWDGTREKFMHRPSSPCWGRIRETRSYCCLSSAQSASRRPLIGVYHFVWGAWYVGLGRGGLGLTGSSTSSGIFTTAFLAFSSLAPSSVDPLSPQRTSILLIPPTPRPP